jgi:hypothetical protein
MSYGEKGVVGHAKGKRSVSGVPQRCVGDQINMDSSVLDLYAVCKQNGGKG